MDGTLLNRNAELSEYTVSVLNRLIDRGMRFSIATARTADSAIQIMSQIKLNLPIILMNGALIYDTQRQSYIKTLKLERGTVSDVIGIMKKHAVNGFVYGISGNKPMFYYKELDTQPLRDYYDDRTRRFNRQWTRVDDYEDCADNHIIYFTLMNTKERQTAIFDKIRTLPSVSAFIYEDVYNDGNWYLECSAALATKYNATRSLRELYGFEKIIGFGDNNNDLPLISACDEFYAVENAIDEVKEKATGIIGRNDEDAVAKWLEERL
jgi:Cof subfamily protein (haloacid dehalogenase superfamily)